MAFNSTDIRATYLTVERKLRAKSGALLLKSNQDGRYV